MKQAKEIPGRRDFSLAPAVISELFFEQVRNLTLGIGNEKGVGHHDVLGPAALNRRYKNRIGAFCSPISRG